jgi:AraC family transcriptional activator of mtrCDE
MLNSRGFFMTEQNTTKKTSVLERYLANLSVEVEPFAICLIDSGWRLSLPGPPCAMLHFVVEGDGWLSCPDGTPTKIGANWAIVIPTGTAHSLDAQEKFDHELKIECTPTEPPVHYICAGESLETDMTVGCGTLNVRYGEAMGLFDHLSEMLIIDLSNVPEIPNLFQMLLNDQTSDAPGRPVLQGAIMTQLLVYMLRELSSQSESSLAWLKALEDPRLAKVIDHILDDPGIPHTVESLADVACMSRSAFSSHFHNAFFKSPMALVNHVRIERAAKMLTTHSGSIEQIGRRVGFSSRSHFSKAFKSHTGVSPASYA